MEAEGDNVIMQEMSVITAAKEGNSLVEKATTAQIYYAEANEKINVLVAMVCETYWKSFHRMLIYMISRFETDEKVFRIANNSFKDKVDLPADIDLGTVEAVDDFDADIRVMVGPTAAGRAKEIQDTMLAIDRGIMANQQIGLLMQGGMLTPEDTKFINIVALMEDLLPKLGKRSERRYFLQAKPPVAPTGQSQTVAGETAPQLGSTSIPAGETAGITPRKM